LLAKLPKHHDPDLLVGFESSDDAAVYRLDDETALVATADFITPPVDDAYLYGQIAAANALSDVYAMGGRPLICLNLVAFPSRQLEPEILHQILAGALSKITEAGAVLAGGHSIENDEPKFGLAVTGTVHPRKIWRNKGAKPGDVLILTKPLGSGVLLNANIRKWVSPEAMNECLAVISTLNKRTAEISSGFDIHAVTDVTGFGLAVHAFEMAAGSSVTMEIHVDDLPIMREALEMYKRGVGTGMNRPNRELVAKNTSIQVSLPDRHEEILFDPQTNGGFLITLPEKQGEQLLQSLKAGGLDHARIIGSVKPLQKNINLVFV